VYRVRQPPDLKRPEPATKDFAMSKNKYLIPLISGAAAVLVTWLLVGTSSPLVKRFFPDPVPLSYAWGQLHTHFYLFYIVLRPAKEFWPIIFYFLIFIQYFLIALGIASLLRNRQSRDNNVLR
jgi:hypothetical protein